MAQVIPSNAQLVGDPGHTPTVHNNIADMLTLICTALGSLGNLAPATPAAAVALVQAIAASRALYPWQFTPEAYGALGNGKVITDATMTSGSNLLNSAAQANFVNATVANGGDIGKSVLVSCAGGGTYSPLGSTTASACTIIGVNSATQAVLSKSSTSATPGASFCCYGSDDTAAVAASQAAAVAYAQSPLNQGTYAEAVFRSVIYCLAGTQNPVNQGGLLGNALIPLPVISPSAEKLTIVYTAASKALDQSLQHWLQAVPQTAGSVLACLRTDGTNDATFGPASVIGAPVDGYGGGLGLYTNMMPVVDGVSTLLPYNSTYGGWDFFGCAEAFAPNSAQMTMAVVPAAPPYPNITNNNNITNTWTFGVRMPSTGNNDRCDVTYHSCEGLCYGLMPSEHTVVQAAREIYCITGIECFSGNAVNMPHAALLNYVSAEACANAIGFFDGTVNVYVVMLDTETSTVVVFDPSSRGRGTVNMQIMGGTAGRISSAGSVVNGGTELICNVMDNAALAGIQTSGALAAPASTVAQQNTYFRYVNLYLKATTGITVIAKGANATGLVAASTVTTCVRLGPGQSYTVTYTGTLTTLWDVE